MKIWSASRYCRGVEGIYFAVWAPTANHVYVIGEFNFWDSRDHLQCKMGRSGIWEGFIPG